MEQGSDLAKILEQIGLSAKEAQVYLALCALESCTAYEIAQHCEVKKPTVYVILEELRQKGLVLKIPHAKKALLAARDIGEYLAEQRGKLNTVQSFLPRIRSLGASQKPKVYFFSGIRGFGEAMSYKFDTMRGKTFCSFYGDSTDADEQVRQLYGRWTPAAAAAGISFRIIMPKSQALSSAKYPDLIKMAEEMKGAEIKYVAEYDQPSNLSIEIADSFVRIDDAKNITSTIIDDAATAQALKNIFEIVWKKGE